jgi:hypothetical protein
MLKKPYWMFRIYTPQDANKALPEVKRRFNTILSQKNNVVALQEEVQKTVESGSLEQYQVYTNQSSSSRIWEL